jgi:fermentation-respiration switch protein FrsA (DUF1100 family)
MIYSLILVLILLLIANTGSVIAFKYITLGKRRSLEQCFELNEKDGLYSRAEFEKLPKEEVEVKTTDGLSLKGIFIEKFKESKKIIIIVHGYNLAFPRSLQFMEMFVNEGFNVLINDQRGHGRSEGKYATYGYYEKYDLDLWVNWAIKKIGEDAVIGLHGQSMGGATVLEYASINKYVKFIIADCPYSDAWQLMKHQFRKLNHVPVFPFAFITDYRLKKRAKFSFKDVSPINAIKNKDIPIMFIHGAEDNFVPTYMSKEMYSVKQGYKKLLIVEGAAHANALFTNKELYEKEVNNFIKEVLN